MPITWYPGHMLTARKEAAEAMGRTDLVIEVLDARAPHSSCNPHIEKLRRANKRPALKLLNKSDLADPARTPAWLAKIQNAGRNSQAHPLAWCPTQRASTNKLSANVAVRAICRDGEKASGILAARFMRTSGSACGSFAASGAVSLPTADAAELVRNAMLD